VIKSRIMRWAENVACMGARRDTYEVLVGKLEVRIPLGRPRCRWENNIKMDLRLVGWVGMDWVDLVQDRDRWWAVVNAGIS
jgi:3-oxoacyl-ACP reductase-like protein